MNIRLIVPICNKMYLYNESYCYDSFLNKKHRLDILQKAMQYKQKIDLVVTSNNFFGFTTNNEIILHNLITKLILKKDLIIGVDYWNKVNPIGGISAKIYYFKKYRNSYISKKRIWETYSNDNKKAKSKFNLQDRIVKIKNKTFCLLSCGDILEECNNGIFPKAEIYLDLAHMSYPPIKGRLKNDCSFINKKLSDESKIVILTHQLSGFKTKKNNFNKKFITSKKRINKRYIKNNNYKYICPNFLNHKIYYFNKFHKITSNVETINYIFVDIDI